MLIALLILAGLPLFQNGRAHANQFAMRSIQLSDAGASGNTVAVTGVGSGTAVKYRVSFTAANAAASMVIDFCSTNPIINDTCTAPTGMTVAAATLNSAQITGNVYGTNSWTLTNTASQVKLANTGAAAGNIAAGQQVFELSGITNPSTVGSFYARMYSYQNNTWGSYVSPTNTANTVAPASGGMVDYGGIAMSTTNTISVTARVQETLTFCVTKANPTTWTSTHDCSDSVVGLAANYPTLSLGHTVTGGTPILDPSAVDTATIYSQLSTNALNGAVINMRNSNSTCGGLSADNGTTCAIPGVPGNTPSPYTAGPITSGTAAFGMYVSNGVADPTGGIGSIAATAAYHDPAHTTFPGDLWYGMDNNTVEGPGPVPRTLTGNVKGTYGSTLGYATQPIFRVNNTYILGATASLTTPAGIYTANLSMVATGTF
ncbi:MAG: hypothetical protein QFB86_03785 [Patescibacteria group bacterium]|nr:hypothetical protein [Patescibacteria group bacterium]